MYHLHRDVAAHLSVLRLVDPRHRALSEHRAERVAPLREGVEIGGGVVHTGLGGTTPKGGSAARPRINDKRAAIVI